MRIVVVDDDAGNTEYVARILSNFETICFENPVDALSFCAHESFDMLITDQGMPEMSGIELAKKIRAVSSDFVALLISAYTESEDLIDAVNSNVIYKYIVKPFSPDFLLQNVYRAEEYLKLQREKERLQALFRESHARLLDENECLQGSSGRYLDQFVGYHASVREIKDLVRMYGNSNRPVMILGETGTGKELLARAIHSLSKRAEKPFVAINCSAVPEHLLETELFGHRRGAFTGAVVPKRGLFSVADGGTVFLDEIGDLPLSFQPKLLRVVQFGTFFALGSTREEHLDVRTISATNRDIQNDVSEGRFRTDLFYRISALRIQVPPLRERHGDVFPIMNSIIERKGVQLPEFSEEAKELLVSYSFPGNVRELENIVEKLHLVAAARGNEIISTDLVLDAMQNDPTGRAMGSKRFDTESIEAVGCDSLHLKGYLERIEERVIRQYLRTTGYNISKTARLLSMSRQGLKNKVLKYGLATKPE